MHSITLWIQFIIFLHAGRCSWPDKWKLQQSPQLSVSVSKASGPWHLQSSQKGKKRCQVLHLPSWKKFGFSLTLRRCFFFKLFWVLSEVTYFSGIAGYGWILPHLVWSIFASFRYRFDTCPEPTCAAQSHHYSFFLRFWNSSNSVSQTNLGSKKSAKSTW